MTAPRREARAGILGRRWYLRAYLMPGFMVGIEWRRWDRWLYLGPLAISLRHEGPP